MSLFSDDQNIGGQLKIGEGIVPAIGEGITKVNGSMYAEGPAVFGGSTSYPPYATVCIGAYANSDDSLSPLLQRICPGILLQEVIIVHTLLQYLDPGFLGCGY